ncbi:MAG: class B sortase [Clostridia bacterium]|nr:class B sortase [Clostridia bacterium]
MKKWNWKRILYWCTVFVLLAVFVVSGYMVWQNYKEETNSGDQYEALEELIEEEPADEKAPLTAAEKYAAVAAKNEHFVGWVSIEGTPLNYPVVQTPNDPEYYLRRGYDQKYSYYGVPFADAACTVPGGDNIVIYGHNMDNGTMFAALEDYRKKSFYEAHRYLRFDTLEGYGTYEVIAVVKTVAGAADEFKYYQFTDATDAAEFEAYVEECKKRSLYEIEATAAYGDELLTLSTCEYTNENGRIAVIAKKIPA